MPDQTEQLLAILHQRPKTPETATSHGPTFAYIWQKSTAPTPTFRTTWYEVGEPIPPLPTSPSVDTYFGVHPCSSIPTTDAQGHPALQHRVRGRTKSIASVACLFAEFDVPHRELQGQLPALEPPPGLPSPIVAPGEEAAAKDHLLASISALEPPPSAIIDSGGGYHCYWFLDTPVLATDAIAAIQAQWVAWLVPQGADPASKDLARVLRLPGTGERPLLNHKYNPPRPVTIVSFQPDTTYSLADLDAVSAPPTPDRFIVSFDPHGAQQPVYPSGAAPEIITVADVRTYITQSVSHELARVRRSVEGNRNDNLNRAAFAIGRYIDAISPSLDINFLAQQLLDTALTTGLPRAEAAGTIARSLVAGREEPVIFRTPEDIIEDAATLPASASAERIALKRELAATLAPADITVREEFANRAKQAGLGGKTSLQKAMSESRPSDADVRDRFLEDHPNVAYHPALGWVTYMEGHYVVTPEYLVKRAIAEAVEDLDRSSLTAGRVESIAKLVYLDVCQPLEVWDLQDLVVCTNGTVTFFPPKLRAHRRDDWSTHAVDYAFPTTPLAALGTHCPNFLRAIGRLSPEVGTFLQEYVGYCLTRDTRHDVMVWIVGRPGCGKSTIVRGILTALGGHATTLSLRELNRSRFALNAIAGKTLIYGTDVGVDFAENTDVLNSLVSGDPLRIEAKYSNPIECKPTAKVLWAMTKMPGLKDPDDGLFRRVQVVRIPPLPMSEQDPDIRLAVEQEGAGILQWAIAGLTRLRARGRFGIPQSVREWTIRYRDDQDKTAHFAGDCLIVAAPPPAPGPAIVLPGEDTIHLAVPTDGAPTLISVPPRAIEVYRTYREWCKVNGYNPLGRIKFYDELRRLGIELVEGSGHALRLKGYKLRPRSEWDPEAIKLKVTSTKAGITVEGSI